MTDAHRAYAKIKVLGLCAVVAIIAVIVTAAMVFS